MHNAREEFHRKFVLNLKSVQKDIIPHFEIMSTHSYVWILINLEPSLK